MTNNEAARAARKIPFDTAQQLRRLGPELAGPIFRDIEIGLRRIVAKQVRRRQFRLTYPGVHGHMYGCALP